MSYTSINDPEFWTNCPASLKHLQDDFRESRTEGSAMAYYLLGPEKDDSPSVGCLQLAPGESIPRHRHSGYRVEVVLKGSLQVEGGPLLHSGDVMMTAPDEVYGPHVAGPDGCTTFEIMSHHGTVCHPTLETPDGPVLYDITTVSGYETYKAAAAKVAAERAKG